MKILIVNKFLYPNGGSETYIFQLGEQLIRMGNEVQYFGMEHEKRCVGNRIDYYTDNMDFHTKRLQKIIYPFKIIYSMEAKKKMVAVLEDFCPDIVHLNNINFQLTPSVIDAVRIFDKKYKRKTKIVATAHDYQWICPNHMLMVPADKRLCFACEGGKYYHCSQYKCIHNSTIKSILGSLEAYFYCLKKVYREIDTIICPSNFLKDKLDTNGDFKGRTIVMHNFMVSKSNNEAERMIDVLNKYRIPERYVLYFGRYSEEKGVRTLLSVCKELSAIPFVFAGKGPLEEEVNLIENVINVGFQNGDELQGLIEHAQFCVFPSEWYENCPFSVMEAQTYGTPVLASRLGGTPELIEEQITGKLFEPGRCDILRKNIEELWSSQETLAKYKFYCKKRRFTSIEQYCKKILEIYQSDAEEKK